MWLHVDAAMAGSAMVLPGDAAGCGGARSRRLVELNPHKWLGTILDCSLLLRARPAAPDPGDVDEPRATCARPWTGEVTQYRDWGIPLGRRFRALKLWFQLRLDGVEAIRARLRRDLENARWLAEQVEQEPGWRVLAPVPLQTVVLRHEPDDLVAADGTVLDGDALDRHTLAWSDSINASGKAMVTASVLDGRWMVRVSIGAQPTERADVEAVWALLREAADRASSR